MAAMERCGKILIALKIIIALMISLWTLFYLFITGVIAIDYFMNKGIILFPTFIPSEIAQPGKEIACKFLISLINICFTVICWKNI